MNPRVYSMREAHGTIVNKNLPAITVSVFTASWKGIRRDNGLVPKNQVNSVDVSIFNGHRMHLAL